MNIMSLTVISKQANQNHGDAQVHLLLTSKHRVIYQHLSMEWVLTLSQQDKLEHYWIL